MQAQQQRTAAQPLNEMPLVSFDLFLETTVLHILSGLPRHCFGSCHFALCTARAVHRGRGLLERLQRRGVGIPTGICVYHLRLIEGLWLLRVHLDMLGVVGRRLRVFGGRGCNASVSIVETKEKRCLSHLNGEKYLGSFSRPC